jgi:hypothetical protein
MLLPLTMKIGEVGHRPYRRTAAPQSAEQRGLKPVIIPLRSKRPRDLGSFGPLQILMGGAEANRATPGDLPQPQAHIKLQSKNFFDLAHNLLAGKLILPFEGEAACHCVVQRCYPPVIIIPAKPNAGYGIGLKLFGFIPEPMFTFIRNPVRDHRGTPFGIIPESRSSCPDSPPKAGVIGCDKVKLIGERAKSGSNIRDEEGNPWRSKRDGASFGPASR